MFDWLDLLGVICCLWYIMFQCHSCSFQCGSRWSVLCYFCIGIFFIFLIFCLRIFLVDVWVSTPGFLMPIFTPGVPNSTSNPEVYNSNTAVLTPLVVSPASPMGILYWYSKLWSSSSCVLMVVNSSAHLTTESGIGTTLNCLRQMRFPVFMQKKV